MRSQTGAPTTCIDAGRYTQHSARTNELYEFAAHAPRARPTRGRLRRLRHTSHSQSYQSPLTDPIGDPRARCQRGDDNLVDSEAQEAPSLEDGGGRGAAEAAGRVERVDAEELVDEAAGDAHHGGAAVLALGVELERLGLGVVVAHPRVKRDVAGLAVGVLR